MILTSQHSLTAFELPCYLANHVIWLLFIPVSRSHDTFNDWELCMGRSLVPKTSYTQLQCTPENSGSLNQEHLGDQSADPSPAYYQDECLDARIA